MDYLSYTFNPLPIAENGGYAILPPGWIHPERKLPTSVLILGKKGIVFIDEENKTLEIRPNRLVLLAPYRVHKGTKKIESTASYFWFHFAHEVKPTVLTENEVSSILHNPLFIKQRLTERALIPQQLDVLKSHKIEHIFRELLNEQENRSYVSWKFQIIFQNLLAVITEAAITSNKHLSKPSSGSSLVTSIISHIAFSLTDPNVCVKNIARKLKYNPDYIGRQFKTIMGIGISEYILKERIKIAVKILQETNDTVNSIAEKSGFSSVRHFLRQFKREKGMTPTELRVRYKAMHINTR
jgi:AraC-like DNA-binding protein